MTMRMIVAKRGTVCEPCSSEEYVIAWNAGADAEPRGWQPNPVISREAAEMCEVDYKSSPCSPKPSRRADLNRVLFPIDWGAGRYHQS